MRKLLIALLSSAGLLAMPVLASAQTTPPPAAHSQGTMASHGTMAKKKVVHKKATHHKKAAHKKASHKKAVHKASHRKAAPKAPAQPAPAGK